MDTNRADIANIGKSVIIKGELSGSEDLYLDGQVEGSIELREHSLTIGPNARLSANIFAKDVSIQGKVDGNITGFNRVELKKTAVLTGNIETQRIVIEDGAFFKGNIEIRKNEPAKSPAAPATASAPQTSAPAAPATTAAPATQASPAAGTAPVTGQLFK
jgi:cytoskeletal protein CcmA (bactofilin family)